MDKTQTMLAILTVLMAVTAVCSVYSVVLQHDNGSLSNTEIDEIKRNISDVNQYGGSISYNGITVSKGTNISFSTDDHNVIIDYKGSNSKVYVPFSNVNSISVKNH